MDRLWRGILVFLAGFSFFIATTKTPSLNVVKTQAEPGKQSGEEHFHEVSVDHDQDHGGKECSHVDQ